MKHAILAVNRDNLPFATAARQYNVSRNQLKRRVIQKNRDAVDDKNILGKYRMVFTEEQEQALCEQIVNMEQRFYGISQNDLCCMAALQQKRIFLLCSTMIIRWQEKYWVAGFKGRHPTIILRTPESTSLARAQGFNKTNRNQIR
ncbi:hypothetical protein JTB14_000907 [Gonioctena quinquepunctata]|nr:hypothetical protein JTB14_000907 [Gonioctena quinquepunctata]